MCGIVGYIGNENVVNPLIEGLEKLEYRGYDSAGISILEEGKIKTLKETGRVASLKKMVAGEKNNASSGIGHTRWATHGEPSKINSHPHNNQKNSISVVHNGIIENFNEIREELIKKGYIFKSMTDTEVIPNLIDLFLKEGLSFLESLFKLNQHLEGSYALGIITSLMPNEIYAVKKDSPLVIGIGNGENYIGSDVAPILNRTKKICFLDDYEIAVISKNKVTVYDSNKKIIEKEIKHIDWSIEEAQKDGFDFFMEKEIFEQSLVCKNTILKKFKKGTIELEGLHIKKETLSKINKIYIIGCGTAYYAGLMGKHSLEKLTKIPVTCDVASEFRYSDPNIDEKTLVIVVSQSGETADTLAVLRMAKEKNCETLGLVNTLGSTISRECKYVFYTVAGVEIAVASTKAYTAQVLSFILLGLYFGTILDTIKKDEFEEIKKDIEILPQEIEKTLLLSKEVKEKIKPFAGSKNVIYIGRGSDYFSSLEGALKVKELAYIHAEGYPAGELKHGPIAILDKNSLTIGIMTQENTFGKTISNLQECKARGSKILCITPFKSEELEKFADEIITISQLSPILNPLLANIVSQFIALNICVHYGFDVDKPRNLAKSVTVE